MAFSGSSTASFVHGSRGTLLRGPEEQATAATAARFFDAVGLVLDRMEGPHDSLSHAAAELLAGFTCVSRAGMDTVLEMQEQVAALEKERDAMRASL